jgi:putative pyoverdin transport system ATP-binding/permease protein
MRRELAEFRQYFTAHDRRQWVVLFTSSLATGLAQSLILAVFNDAVKMYGEGRENVPHLLLVLGLVALASAAGYFVSVRGSLVSNTMAMRLRNRLLDQLGAANLRLIERVQPSALHYHLMGTIGQLAGAYGSLLSFVTSLVLLVCNFIYLGWLSLPGLGAAIVITSVGVVVHFRQEARNLQHRLALDRLQNMVGSRHREYIDGYKELRLSEAKTADYRERIDRDNRETIAESLAVTRTSTIGDLATNFFQFVLVFVIVFVLPSYSRTDPVVILQIMAAIFITMGPLSGVVGAFPGFTRARVALANLRMLQREMTATREPPASAGGHRLPAFESIELRDLCFAFEEETSGEGFRLGPIDLTIRRGDVLFIIGGNGSGKTVLMRVLTGLYHHTGGAILYNGRELQDGDRQEYRELFSAVFSDFHLFRELVGMPGADEALVQRWIERLDLAGKTVYANGKFTSVALSAGQRKRLAFLVSMIEDRPIFVLDEFGAEQDPGHRRTFYRELLPELRARGKTVIVVTHDDAYFDAAERIVKMDFGKIVRAG